MSDYMISLPSTSSHAPSSPPSSSSQRTNSLAVTSLPKTFFHPVVLTVLKSHFESYGEINQWVPLPGFGRIIVVYTEEEHAEVAKTECDPIILRGISDISQTILRVYRADPNPLITSFAIEKNFLISPPGSPPVGWEPIKEDPPNATPLADDLINALRLLRVHERGPSVEVLIHPEDSCVSVFVEDCDRCDSDVDIEDEDWVYGQTAPARSKWRTYGHCYAPSTSSDPCISS
ncbi:Calcipressin-domain-containing protein [Armillaria luteobubalina]|uniref:Calcipressin-domain-containing protein n=1 Tax=Armillaria luteobubalina TaxID=153913 RepID=A0AA39PZP3_9AGAR|nr:Calcipressin-domain-containing protein [Armillaria luteobubalina]